MKKIVITISFAFFLSVTMHAQQENFTIVKNNKGADLGYSPESGVKILTINGKKFKDLNKNGKLDKYEDWRLPADERAKDLASKMSVEQIAGLMLYSRHQSLPAGVSGYNSGTYNGKVFPESNAKAYDLADQQKAFLQEDNLRHVLITNVESPEVAALWNNKMQAFVEGIGLGIPSNTSTDPRHIANVTSEFNAGAGGTISMWPDGLGMAATFDPKIVEQFGEIAAKEYRALGIATALSPQIDLGTEPRWYRISMTFGESPSLTRDMGRAYIDGFQTSYGKDEIKDGWGYKSVNAMVKHWPSGGAEEGGRDGHWAYGKFAVYPGNNLQQHIDPFVNGAFKLKGKTSKASAVMPYYTITFDQDKKYNENVANGYSKYIITDLLRDKYGYDGVVCTDWLITGDEGKTPNVFAGKPWGVENLSIVDRHYKAIIAGVDQFGGNNDKKPVLAAYEIGVKEYGESFMRARFERSAVRLLKNIFRVGLFENPYLNIAETKEVVGNSKFMEAGYDAQLKSIVLLKNKASILPLKEKKTVFIPKIYTASTKDWWGVGSTPKLEYPVNLELVEKYYNVTDEPSKADFAIVFVTSPKSLEDGYDLKDRTNGSNGYVPISLQYGTYTATEARAKSIAAGDQVIDPTITDRTYKNKTVTAANTMDLRTILDTKDMMGDKPVIVSVTASKPMIFREFESQVDGIVLNFGVSAQAVLDIISGKTEPSGLLPVQMPANMETVEKQFEDVPFDMVPHKDSEGNSYDFAYGLNWNGVIKDARTNTYKKE
ncbi:glycoside hydrolase family 3 C-terminal domain-containing protein [Flavobacterium sp. ALJ2]|uniref:glycoside hydrolase family 3 protein n=1 Tax=Flavobacterium sp. ALJ2 TaxID=2786960 RepID=UPI00189F3BC1|nr:glycoside hydrolase family 3 N-terminal domain-containing protein [Flavobacterium sp. ALJ2]MBF7092505.1 glycoside hydrolase family 3 C-terminal domain-containing protein [Flavobacterium sp. ALJ2]